MAWRYLWHELPTRFCRGAKIGKGVSLGQNVFVGNHVIIGDRCKVQNNVSVYDNVTLEEGVTMMTQIVDCDLAALKIGQKVKLVFKPTEGDGPPVPTFTPV